MFELKPELLLSPEVLHSASNTPGEEYRGSYNPMQFVLRLNKEVHRVLKGMKPGLYSTSELNAEIIQANSTFLHEKIHWWQHVGSHYGLISSLKFPAQAHIIHQNLQNLVDRGEACKSIFNYSRQILERTGREANRDVNQIINYWFDISCAGKIIEKPESILELGRTLYFWSVGHSYYMMWASVIALIASVCDPEFAFLPNVKQWDENFKQLEREQKEGFYKQSPVRIPPVGVHALLEGQARFCQLQYLYFASEQQWTFGDFERSGMLEGIYVEAFEIFLKVLKEEWPEYPDDPLVALFLLICDLAINPTDGFPLDVDFYETFIISNDPGTRFLMLCQVVANDFPALKKWIVEYSKKEYIQVSELLSRKIVCQSPYQGMRQVNEWIEKEPRIRHLLEEEHLFRYDTGNMAVRLFFSKYLRFQQDKYKYPHFFCWPGVGLTDRFMTDIPEEEKLALDERHRALFMDDVDGLIQPKIFPSVSNEQVLDTFQQFYSWNCIYDMVQKWVLEEGPFRYDYDWLIKNASREEIKRWIDEHFKSVYGILPEEITIL